MRAYFKKSWLSMQNRYPSLWNQPKGAQNALSGLHMWDRYPSPWNQPEGAQNSLSGLHMRNRYVPISVESA